MNSSEPELRAGHAFHFSLTWGSRHGGSIYSQALLRELALRGWLVTVLAERFEQPLLNQVYLHSFFRRAPRYWLRKSADFVRICRLVVRASRPLIIVQGDLPRLSYLLLQCLAPLIFIRQDGILTCPANNRFLTQSGRVCRRRAGFGCLLKHRREHCFGQLPLRRQVGRLAVRLRDRLLLRCIGRFVCSSSYLAQIHGRPARVLYPPRISITETGLPAQPAPPRDLARLIFCGRLEPVKGAVDALMMLTLLPGNYHLDVLGNGPDLGRLMACADQFRLANRVSFHGWVDAVERDKRLASAGALLMPSRWDEAFGMVGPEAFAQGTPVVAYDVGGVSEWCRAGAGILVSCGDMAAAAAAVRHLTADPAKWATFSAAAKQVAASEFPPERFGREAEVLVRQATVSKRMG